MPASPENAFSFGKNWQRFLQSVNEERVRQAEKSLSEFLELPSLEGKMFLDIGCGSGLFSFAAFNLGASRVVSIDVDPFSVQCCEHMAKKVNAPDNWSIKEGSILDKQLISELGSFDIVYSWGVLHHTGRMWEAIRNSAELVNAEGYYYISIYNRVEGRMGSQRWLKRKRLYNHSGKIVKFCLELRHMAVFFAAHLRGLRNPLTIIKNYSSMRGMSWRRDITDWVGGYPYEFATVEEIFRFMKTDFPEFQLANIKTTNSLSTNWFLFRRVSPSEGKQVQ